MLLELPCDPSVWLMMSLDLFGLSYPIQPRYNNTITRSIGKDCRMLKGM